MGVHVQQRAVQSHTQSIKSNWRDNLVFQRRGALKRPGKFAVNIIPHTKPVVQGAIEHPAVQAKLCSKGCKTVDMLTLRIGAAQCDVLVYASDPRRISVPPGYVYGHKQQPTMLAYIQETCTDRQTDSATSSNNDTHRESALFD
jgi:hypothetical protein